MVDIEGRSKEIAHLPVLILSGEFDPTYKAGWHERLGGMFPNHRFDTMRGAGHFPTAYSPEYFASAIQRWWDDIGAPRREIHVGEALTK